MRILVVGASQGTGALAVKSALARGHEVTAFARSPDKLAIDHPKLAKLRGDFHDKASVEGAVRGHDAVIITASATSLAGFKKNPNYFSLGTGYVIEAMKASGARRLVVLSALGVGDSRKLVGFVVETLLVKFILRVPFQDHERQEKMTRESGLDWVIARPGQLTDGPALGRYAKKISIEPVQRSISRADVADFLVEAAESDAWIGHAVQIGG
jgi:putative NADH-flavin reductase